MAEKIIITGGPGCGKSEAGKMLSLLGYGYLAETPELLIKREQVKEILNPGYQGNLPWNNLPAFEDYVIAEQKAREAKYVKDNPGQDAFLDRSLIDPIAYCHIAGIPVPDGLMEAIEKAGYHKTMFMPDQHKCYQNSLVRREGQDEAIRLQNELRDVYSGLGYKIVNVPDFAQIPEGATGDVKDKAIQRGIIERAKFILASLADEGSIDDRTDVQLVSGDRPRSMYQLPGGR